MTMAVLMSFALLFLQASVTCVLAGAILLGALALARRRWPGMASQRMVWLLAMGAAAGVFVAALLPAPSAMRVLPSIELPRPAPVAALAEPDMAGGGEDEGGLALEQTPAPRWLLVLAAGWLVCYGAGLGVAVWRFRRACAALRDLRACAMPLDGQALARHAGFGAVEVDGAEGVAASPAPGRGRGQRPPLPAVFECAAPISPMLAGLLRPVLLLPSHLRQMAPHQQQLIVAHELAHWRRRDHLWLHASLLLRTVFWFNPAMSALAGGLSHAQELGCDRQVLARLPMAARRDYAAALVAQLKWQQDAGMQLAPAFGGARGSGAAALAERIVQLRLPDLGGSTRLAGAGKAVLGVCCAAVVGAGVLLQPAFAWRAQATAADAGTTPMAGPVSGSVPDLDAAPAAFLPAWQAPLAHVKVNSGYGPRPGRPGAQAGPFHHGVDLSARRGTVLRAPAGGVVLESTDLYQGQARFGQVIVIDHGGGLRSMYAHLDQRAVRAGDTVAAGQAIGKTGNTGKTTGPHLHFEVAHDGVRIDPQRLIAALR